MAAWTGWERAVLTALGAPSTVQNVKFLDGWNAYEGSTCRFNPLNTTEPWPFAVNCNNVGVKSYASASDGARATVRTLENGRYPDVVAALRSGNPYTYPQPRQVAAEVTTWGTPNFAGAYLLEATGVPTTPSTGAPAGTYPRMTPPPVRVTNAWRHVVTLLYRDIPANVTRSARARARMTRKAG